MFELGKICKNHTSKHEFQRGKGKKQFHKSTENEDSNNMQVGLREAEKQRFSHPSAEHMLQE